VPQLQASFENREQLEKPDRDIIKKLGLKFRGSQNYPQFRSIRAGFMPYFVTQDEARFLIYALEQTLETAPRIRDDENLLADPDEDLYLVRVSENGAWRDEIMNIPPPDEFIVFVDAPKEIVAELKNFPQKKGLVLEIDFDFAPMPVREKNQRPFFPKILIITEARQGIVVAFELVRPEETLTETHETIPYHLVENLRKLGVRPEEIRVKNEMLFEMLRGFTQQINVKLRLVDELPSIEMAQESMFGFFGGGGMF
jgi:hypothetical protein